MVSTDPFFYIAGVNASLCTAFVYLFWFTNNCTCHTKYHTASSVHRCDIGAIHRRMDGAGPKGPAPDQRWVQMNNPWVAHSHSGKFETVQRCVQITTRLWCGLIFATFLAHHLAEDSTAAQQGGLHRVLWRRRYRTHCNSAEHCDTTLALWSQPLCWRRRS